MSNEPPTRLNRDERAGCLKLEMRLREKCVECEGLLVLVDALRTVNRDAEQRIRRLALEVAARRSGDPESIELAKWCVDHSHDLAAPPSPKGT